LAGSGRSLRSADVVRRFGISGKALRLYEARGLVRAERTAAGWRVYGPDQIARLHQVIALKSFGFPLSRIAELLSGGLPQLAAFLELHEQVLRREVDRLGRALELLSAARTRLAERGDLSSDDLMNLTKEIVMTEHLMNDLAQTYEAIAAKHLSPTERAMLDKRGYRGMAAPDPDWEMLHAEAARLMAIGDPASLPAMELARAWMHKVFQATGADPTLTRKMKAVARETLEQPSFAAASSSSVAVMDFVAQAYGAAIAAGLMPKPAEVD
jgi:MerR family transcriptional regulator, thiopeptide resistance regulator